MNAPPIDSPESPTTSRISRRAAVRGAAGGGAIVGVLALTAGRRSAAAQDATPAALDESAERHLGIVQGGQLMPLRPEGTEVTPLRLTEIAVMAAMTPESGELDLTEHEGAALLVAGHRDGDWIYSAEIVDVAGPILTSVVQVVFQPTA
jgi:hypothetical protein